MSLDMRAKTTTNKRAGKFDKTGFSTIFGDNSDFSGAEDNESNSLEKSCQPGKKVKLRVNKLRVHYFFTELYAIEDLVTKSEIEIRITDGPNWNKTICSGRIAPFSNLYR